MNLRSSKINLTPWSLALLVASQALGLSAIAQDSAPALSQTQLLDSCANFVLSNRLGATRPITSYAPSAEIPSVEEVSKAIQVTQCNWEFIKDRAQAKAKGLTARINLIKGLSTSASVLGAGGTAAAAAGSNTGLAIGSGAVAVIGIFAGVFGSESTIKRRDMCNQLVTLDPTMQTSFGIWRLQLSSEAFRKGFISELQLFNSSIDAGVKGCIADSWSS
jgi:hypothetical protein